MLLNPYRFFSLSPAPLTGIDTIALVGASIEAGIIDTYAATMAEYMRVRHGITVTIEKYGYSGADVGVVQTNWNNTIKPAYQARPDGGAGVLIMTMPAGNSVTTLRPYATANTTTLASTKATYDALITDMRAVCGARNVIAVDHTFRLYGTPYPITDCITDESLGSKPFNEAWVDPQALASDWKLNGVSWCNPYPIAFNWYSLILADSTHYTSLGYALLALFWMDCAAAAIKGTLPPVVVKKANPIGDQKPKSAKAIVVYSNSALVVRSSIASVFNARGATATAEVPFLIPVNGYEPVFGLGARPAITGGNANTSLGTGDTSLTMMHDGARTAYGYTTSASFVLLEELINQVPGSQTTWELMCARQNTAGTTRFAEFSTDGTTVIGELDTACVSGAIPRVFTITLTADSNGKSRLYFRCKAGNTTGAYVNAITFTPV